MIPQIIMLVLTVMGFTLHLVKHGEEKSDKTYNVFYYLITSAISYALLYWGGFFNVFFN